MLCFADIVYSVFHFAPLQIHTAVNSNITFTAAMNITHLIGHENYAIKIQYLRTYFNGGVVSVYVCNHFTGNSMLCSSDSYIIEG